MTEIIPDKLSPLPIPWRWQESELFEQELYKEISKDHVLHNKIVKAIAVRKDQDEVLYEILNDENHKFAVVHLTWSKNRETNSMWPSTKLFINWNEVLQKQIMYDHVDFNEEE